MPRPPGSGAVLRFFCDESDSIAAVLLSALIVLSVVAGPVGAVLEPAGNSSEDVGERSPTVTPLEDGAAETSSSLRTDDAVPSVGTAGQSAFDLNDWPTAGGDSGRSGYDPNASGPKTGAEARWVYEAENRSQTEPAVVVDGRVFVPTRDGLQVLDNETGEVAWNDTGLNVRRVAVSEGVAVVVSSWTDDEIRAYDATDGAVLWSETGFEAGSSVVSNGTLYVERPVNRGHYLYAFDLQSGTELWSVNYADETAGGIAASGDTVYATGWLSDSFDRERAVYALDASNGEERWRFEVEGHIGTNPVVANGTVYVGAGDEGSYGGETYDPKFYALNATDGHVEWMYDAHVRPNGAAVANGTVFVSMGNGVHALDATTGERRWVRRMAGDTDYGLTYTRMNANPPAVADGVVYATNDRGFVYALDDDTGAVRWSYRVEGRATAPAIADGRVYVHAPVGESGANVVRVYALETPPFAFSGLSVSATTAEPGERVTVDVTVENVDDEPREYDLSLMADSPLPVDPWAEDDATGTLNAGESVTLTFEGRFNATGEWNLSVKRAAEREFAVGPVTVDVAHANRVDDWPTWKFDAGSTGSNPDAVAPKRHLQERWNVSDLNRRTRPVVRDGLAYVVHSERRSGQNNVHSLAAYDVETGSREWAFDVSAHDRVPAGSATVRDGAVYLYATPFDFDGDGVGPDGTVFALNATDGSVEWRYDTELNRSVVEDQAPVVADGRVYVAGGTFEPNTDQFSNGSVLALNAADGTLDWKYERTEETTTELFHAVSADGGSVYATLQNEEWVDGVSVHSSDLVALDAATGSMRWSTESRPFDLDTSEQPVVRGDLVYVVNQTTDSGGDPAPELHAIDVADGSDRWVFTPGAVTGNGWRLHDPVVTEDAVFLRQRELGSGSLYDPSFLYRLDAATGTPEWNRSTPALATLLAVDGLLYGGEGDDEPTHVYDAVTGETYGSTDLTARASGTVQAVSNGTMLTVEESGQPLRALVEGGAFEFTDLGVDAERLGVGENVTVTATVTNVGELTRAWSAKLLVSPDSSRQSHHVWNSPSRGGTLAPGESRTVTWTVELRDNGDYVFTLQPENEDTGLNRYLYDRTTGVTASVGDERDGTVVPLGGPRDVAPGADSWPKESFDAGNTGNNAGTGAPSAVGPDVVDWSVNHSYEWTTGPTLANGTVFVGGNHVGGGEFVYAYDATDGGLRWQYQTFMSRDVEVPPTYAGGYLYTADSDGRVYQFDAATGERLWTYGVGDVGGITVVDDVAYVTGSGYDDSYYGLVHALNATTREVLWTFERDSSSYGMSVKPAVVDGTVYVTSDDGHTYALDAATGEEAWNRSIAGSGSRLHSPVVGDGVVYVDDATYGESDGRIYAFDATDGSTLWSTPANVDGYTGASPALANDTLYFTADGAVRAVNATSGDQRWGTAVCTAARHSPAYADGIVYVPTTDSAIRAYDADTGELVWRYDAYGETAFTPAVVGGRLYATGLENADGVYSLAALEGGPTDEPKPLFAYSGLGVSASNVSTGQPVTVSATVENQGDAACGYEADFAIDGTVVDNATGTVGTGYNDDATVEFTHTFADTGTYEVTIEDLPPVEVNVTAPQPEVDVTPPSVEFATHDVGAAPSETVTVRNLGRGDLDLIGADVTGPNASEFYIDNDPFGHYSYLWWGGSVSFYVYFTPQTPGNKYATLEVYTNDSDEGTYSIPLSGTAAGPADVDVAPTSLEFEDVAVGDATAANVTVSNVGGAPLSFDGAQLTGADADAYAVTNGEVATIAAGESHAVTVEFAPTNVGSADATLTIRTDDPDEPTVTVPLTGDSYDDAAPTVEAVDVTGSYRDGTTVYANETVDVAVNVTDEFGTVESVDVTLDSRGWTYRKTASATRDETTGNWTARFDGDDVVDDGRYDVVVTARDDAGSRTEVTAADRVNFDRTAPGLAAAVGRVNATAANVTVNASESLRPGTLTVDVEHPDGTRETVEVTDDGGRWTGTFDLSADGQYNVTATARDVAGNRGTGRATARFANENTDAENTITVRMQPSGLFVRFTADRPVNDTYVTMTESRVALEPLVRGQAGVKFLNAALGKRLSDNLSYAVIGIPVDESLLTPGTDVDDVTIRHFNETTREWTDVPTTVRNVSVGGTTGRYWVANVTHFSTYGAVASDATPPAVTATTPTDGREFASGTSSATLSVEYEDAFSGVDASRTVVLFDGVSVTDDAATTVTSGYAEFEATGLADGASHTLEVTVEDRAGNSHTETVSFTVDSAASDGGSPSSGGDDTPSSDGDDGDDDDNTNGGSRSVDSADEGSDQPTGSLASMDGTALDDGRFVFRIRDAGADETLSATLTDGTIGATGVALERLAVTVDAAGDSELRVTGDATPTDGPALPPERGDALAYLGVSNAGAAETTLRLSVRRDVLDRRGVGPADVVGYRLVDGSWSAVALTQVDATNDAVVYEASADGLTAFVLATNEPAETTTATEAPPVETETAAEPTATASPTTAADTPGFGLVPTVLALLAAACVVGRRFRRGESERR